MNEDGEIEITVDGIDYIAIEESAKEFKILCDDDDYADIKISDCGEYYLYEIYPEFSSLDDCSGQSYVGDHDGIVEFFRWVIGMNI